MRGTLVCGVTDGDDGRRALELAVELSHRLDLRLVLVHASDEMTAGGARDGAESALSRASREDAERRLGRLADTYGVAETAECRFGRGDTATLLGRVATEEAAGLIVVGARARGRLRRGLESRLAEQLEAETSVPVLIAPPRARGVTMAA